MVKPQGKKLSLKECQGTESEIEAYGILVEDTLTVHVEKDGESIELAFERPGFSCVFWESGHRAVQSKPGPMQRPENPVSWAPELSSAHCTVRYTLAWRFDSSGRSSHSE